MLAAAYDVRRALNYVRGVFHRASELNAAGKHLSDTVPDYAKLTDEEQARFQAAQVIITRMDARQQVWDEVVAIIPSAKAVFGEAIEQHLENLIKQYNLVRNAAVSHAQERPLDAERGERHRALMYNMDDPENADTLTKQTDADIAALEAVLLPILRADHEGDS